MKNQELLNEAVAFYGQKTIALLEEVDAIINVVPFLKEKKHLMDKQALSLMKEFFGPFKKDKRTVVSNEEKALVSAINNAASKSKVLRNLNVSNLEDAQESLSNFVNAVLDVRTKEEELDPSEISQEMRNSIDMLFGMAIFTLGQLRGILWKQLTNLNSSVPSSRLRVAVQKYQQHANDSDMQSMINKINIPLGKRIAGMFGSGLDSGGSVGQGVGGARG